MAQMFDVHAKDTDTAIPHFYTEHVNTGKMDSEGLPIIDEVEMIKIITIGDPHNIPCVPVREEHRKRFAKHYEAFKQNLDPPVDGMPLKEWAGADKGEVMMLESKGVRTVQQLANASEATLPAKLHDLLHRARVYMKSAEGGKVVEELRKENANLKRSRTMLTKQIEEAKSIIKAYELKEDRKAS